MESSTLGKTVSIFNDSFTACQKDDLYVFKAGDVFEETDAGVKCELSSETVKSTWSLNGSSIKITGLAIDGTVSSLTSSKLVVKQTETAMGITTTIITTFTKQ